MKRTSEEWQKLVADAMARFNALTPEQQVAERVAQRQSWVRGMTAKCEHDRLDFEQCPDCRG